MDSQTISVFAWKHLSLPDYKMMMQVRQCMMAFPSCRRWSATLGMGTLGTPSLIFSAISSQNIQTTYILCWEFLFEQYVTGFLTVKNMWWNCNWNTMLCKESIRRNVPLTSTLVGVEQVPRSWHNPPEFSLPNLKFSWFLHLWYQECSFR